MKINQDLKILYEDFEKNHFQKLKTLKTKELIFKTIFVISIIFLIIDFLAIIGLGINKWLVILFIVFSIILSISVFNKKNNYSKYYKLNIIKPLIDLIFDKSKFNISQNYDSEKYTLCNWGYFSYYTAYDSITTKVFDYDLELYNVYTSWQNNAENNRVEFGGIFGYVNLNKNYDGSFKIIKSKGKGTTFDDLFNSKNEINNDLKEFLKEFYLKNNYGIDIFIQDDFLYFRLHSFEPFEPNMIKDNYKKIEEVYNILNNIKELLMYLLKYLENNDIKLIEKETVEKNTYNNSKSFYQNIKQIAEENLKEQKKKK